MKNTVKISTSLFLLLAFVIAPVVSLANVEGEEGIKIDSVSGDQMTSDINIKTKSQVDAETEMVEVENGLEIELSNDTNANPGPKDHLEVAEMKVNVAGVAVVSPTQVKSEDDLEVYRANVSVRDESVARVDLASEEDGTSEIRVVYRHPGKFLGIIPMTIKSTTVVDTNADNEVMVSSSLPWWSFLVSSKNYVRSDLETRVKSNPTIVANAKVNASATNRAEIVEAVIAEVEAEVSTDVSVEN